MPNWLKPKLLERPDTDTIDQLCTLASQQIVIREMCNREEYFDDGFNEITESNTDKKLKAITVISNNQKELEQKLKQRTAPKIEPSEQGPVKIFTPHYPQQVYRQSYRQNFRPQYQNYQPNYRQPNYLQFQQNYRPQQQYAPRANNYREFRPQFNAPRPHFIIMNSHKLGIIGLNLQTAPHLFTQLMLIDLFTGFQQKIPLKTFLDRE